MKNSIIVVLLILSLVSCHVEKKEYYKNSGQLLEYYQVKWPNTTKRDGFSKIYNMDGTLVFDGSYKDGLLDGTINKYFDNSNLQMKLEYSEGRLMNVFEYYDIYGNSLDYGDFSNGSGNLKIYNDNGQLRSEGPVLNGNRNGKWSIYTDQGFEGYIIYSEGKINGKGELYSIF